MCVESERGQSIVVRGHHSHWRIRLPCHADVGRFNSLGHQRTVANGDIESALTCRRRLALVTGAARLRYV